MRIFFLTITLFISACAPIKKEPIPAFDLVKLKAIPISTLCLDYYTLSKQGQLTPNSRAQFENVLKDKGVPEADIIKARENKIYIGMSQCGLYMSWGKPVKENKTVTKYSSSIQHIYGYSISNRNYVYTENGIVRSWQN